MIVIPLIFTVIGGFLIGIALHAAAQGGMTVKVEPGDIVTQFAFNAVGAFMMGLLEGGMHFFTWTYIIFAIAGLTWGVIRRHGRTHNRLTVIGALLSAVESGFWIWVTWHLYAAL